MTCGHGMTAGGLFPLPAMTLTGEATTRSCSGCVRDVGCCDHGFFGVFFFEAASVAASSARTVSWVDYDAGCSQGSFLHFISSSYLSPV